MTAVKVFAPAKVNLALHVTGQRSDGYHELDTLVAFADVGDLLTLKPAKKTALQLSGPEAGETPEGIDNIAVRIAEEYFPIAIELEKNLPVAAGIGGGSADAAAVYRALGQLHPRTKEQPAEELSALGADIPMCVHSVPVRARGIGDRLDRVELPPLFAVLCNPRVAISTPNIFQTLEEKCNSRLNWPPTTTSPRHFIDWLTEARNDLETPACKSAPQVQTVLMELENSNNVRLVRMSGSGGTCFGLFDSREAASAAASAIAENQPKWWVVSTVLGDASGLAKPILAD